MGLKDKIAGEMADAAALRIDFSSDVSNLSWVEGLANTVTSSLIAGGKVIFAGNGGSFADAQHLTAEFLGRFMVERAPLAAHCLGTNSSLVTAVGNDYAFEQVFSRELRGIGKAEDTLILISTSGNSENLLQAAEVGQDIGMKCFGLAGKGGGKLAEAVDTFVVQSDHTARIQEMHITIGHILCGLVDETMGASA